MIKAAAPVMEEFLTVRYLLTAAMFLSYSQCSNEEVIINHGKFQHQLSLNTSSIYHEILRFLFTFEECFNTLHSHLLVVFIIAINSVNSVELLLF